MAPDAIQDPFGFIHRGLLNRRSPHVQTQHAPYPTGCTFPCKPMLAGPIDMPRSEHLLGENGVCDSSGRSLAFDFRFGDPAFQRFGALRNPPMRGTRSIVRWVWKCWMEKFSGGENQCLSAKKCWIREGVRRSERAACRALNAYGPTLILVQHVDQNIPFPRRIGGRDDALLFHQLHECGGAVVADA